jgi:hypothetical protein
MTAILSRRYGMIPCWTATAPPHAAHSLRLPILRASHVPAVGPHPQHSVGHRSFPPSDGTHWTRGWTPRASVWRPKSPASYKCMCQAGSTTKPPKSASASYGVAFTTTATAFAVVSHGVLSSEVVQLTTFRYSLDPTEILQFYCSIHSTV